MQRFTILGRLWKDRLGALIRSANQELFISSPFVTRAGAEFVASNLRPGVRRTGTLNVLTNLSPENVYQGSTDPAALRSLCAANPGLSLYHLPRLHAKVYVADLNCAIITSGNLTSGGLSGNYEYGVQVTHRLTVEAIRDDIREYAELGVRITSDRLSRYCSIASEVRESFRKKQAATSKSLKERFNLALRDAEDELVRFRLAGGAMHTVFARTVLYVLRSHGPLRTDQLHPLIETIHPELCDNTIDRVIDGKRFGKKWKHAVRTAQQELKRAGLVELSRGRWRISSSAAKRGPAP